MDGQMDGLMDTTEGGAPKVLNSACSVNMTYSILSVCSRAPHDYLTQHYRGHIIQLFGHCAQNEQVYMFYHIKRN